MVWLQIVTAVLALASFGAVLFMLTPRRRKATPAALTSTESAVRELETRMKAIEMEWEDTYDRVKKAYRKMGGEARWTGQATPSNLAEPSGGVVAETDPKTMRRGILLRARRPN